MKTVAMEDTSLTLAASARDAQSEPVVVTENGTPVAVLMAIENADLETVSLSTNPRFLPSSNTHAPSATTKAASPARTCGANSASNDKRLTRSSILKIGRRFHQGPAFRWSAHAARKRG